MGFTIACAFFTGNQAQASIEDQRQIFHDASYALNQKQHTRFNRLLKQLDGYPVKAYLEYDALKQQIHKASKNEVAEFLEKHADYSFHYQLRANWLSVLAQREDWRNYLLFFDNRDNTRFQCLAFKARLELSMLDNINEDIKKVWLNGYSQPHECNLAFDYLLENYPQAEQIIWLRIERAFNARRPGLARYIGKNLDTAGQQIVETWYYSHQRPEKSLRRLMQAEDDAITRKIIVHAVDLLARKNSSKARELWLEIEDQFAFSQPQKNRLVQRIALSSASQGSAIADELLSELPPELKNDQAYLWLARIQLKNQNWVKLADTIKQMPKHLQQENEWQYWLARALEILGNTIESEVAFESVSEKSSYYGFLAADRLKKSYRIEQQSAALIKDFDEQRFLADNPYMLRARELFYLDRVVEANREWFQALRHFDSRQMKQAAALASDWKWHDSAIRTVAKTAHRSDYELRFPMPYRQKVMSHALAKQLDPSVIYGVMRRESLFNPLAKSSVGALGLMQLMPSTARQVAKSLGLRRPRQADILKIENNINLGTHYFKSILNRFGNNVSLAAAAYNAGPLNVKRWLPLENSMPADLWVEIVPFKETRNYVQAVLAYATVFDKSLGKDTLISSRMLDVRSNY